MVESFHFNQLSICFDHDIFLWHDLLSTSYEMKGPDPGSIKGYCVGG